MTFANLTELNIPFAPVCEHSSSTGSMQFHNALFCGSALQIIAHFSSAIMTSNKLSRSFERLSHIKLQLSWARWLLCAEMLNIWNYVFLFSFVCISAKAALFDST